MKTVQLSGSPRVNVGKRGTKEVRNSGQVPCVLYGSGKQMYFSVKSIDIEKIIFSPDLYKVELDIDGVKKAAVIQEKQMHPLTDKPMHVDFLELSDDKVVKVRMPLRITGRAKGVLNGGNLTTNFRTLRVAGLPSDLPEEVEIDVTPVRIGQSIRVKSVEIPGVKILEDGNAVIVAVKMARGAVNVADEDEAEDTVSETTEEN